MYKFVTLIATECDQYGKNPFNEKSEIIVPIKNIIAIIDFQKIITKDYKIQIDNRHFINLEIKDPEKFKSIII